MKLAQNISSPERKLRKHLKGAKMENLNAETVKKALECCAMGNCAECSYSGADCENEMNEDALALINSQEQGIGELAEGIKEAKANNLSEIKTRFAMRYGTYTDKDMTPITEVFRVLDQIAKEMLEGEK
jgi:hypothetical protein